MVANGNTDFYAFSTNAGDNLALSVNSTNPLLSPTELFLYDQLGDLVAVAAGNGIDGFSSKIDFTIPAGSSGNWEAAVSDSPGNPSGVFSYDLSIQGATGVPLAPPNSVPEPASASLLGGLMAGLGLCRYLKTKKDRRKECGPTA
jgi:hypothetical protein